MTRAWLQQTQAGLTAGVSVSKQLWDPSRMILRCLLPPPLHQHTQTSLIRVDWWTGSMNSLTVIYKLSLSVTITVHVPSQHTPSLLTYTNRLVRLYTATKQA